jgi:hypothetical protein
MTLWASVQNKVADTLKKANFDDLSKQKV